MKPVSWKIVSESIKQDNDPTGDNGSTSFKKNYQWSCTFYLYKKYQQSEFYPPAKSCENNFCIPHKMGYVMQKNPNTEHGSQCTH